MVAAGSQALSDMRAGLTVPQRELIDAIWLHFRTHNEWPSRRVLRERLGEGLIEAECQALGVRVVRTLADEDTFRLTFLGVLLSGDGERSERLLVRYLEYVRDRYRDDSSLDWVGSAEVGAALALSAEDSHLLRQLIRLSHWWGGGSSFGQRAWTIGLPVDVDDLVSAPDLESYVRTQVLAGRTIESRAGDTGPSGSEFAFVPDGRLRDRLAADWHQAQDVCQVRAWKSCLILCGGILETLLTQPWTGADKLSGRNAVDRLVALAEERGLFRSGSVQISPALRAYKTFLSPERSARFTLTRADADAALAAVRSCVKQLGTK